jgi:two-component system sensor histidine kinase YesM
MYRNSIRNKLFLFLFIAIVLPTLSSIIITYMFSTKSLKTEAINENGRFLYQIKMNIARYMDNLNEASLSVYYGFTKNSPGLYSIARFGDTDFSTRNEIYRSLQTLLHFDENIFQVHLYSHRDNTSYLMVDDVLKIIGEVRNPFERVKTDSSVLLESAHVSSSYGKAEGLPYVPYTEVFSFHRQFYLQPNTTPLGVISFDVKLDYFSTILNDIEHNDSQVFVIDAEGKTIFNPWHERFTVEQEQSGWFKDILSADLERGNFEYSFGRERGVLLYEKIGTNYLNWYIIKYIPYSELYRDAAHLTRINSLVLCLFLIIAVIITFIISTYFTEPIKQLIMTINKVESGNLKAKIETNRTDEIGFLFKRFSKMIHTIDNLVELEYKWKLANKVNQLKALQAQINPHFLNNALQSIATRALYKEHVDIYKSITMLGKMMDYHMDTNEETVPLKREIDHVRSYLALQGQRFERLQVSITVDNDMEQIIIPKMILQPLVENYFKHGVVSGQDGILEINCYSLPRGLLRMVVKDNGSGMSEEEGKLLQHRLLKANENEDNLFFSNNIGLMNVYMRLKLFYGHGVKMKVELLQPTGFQVTIEISQDVHSHEEVDHEGINSRR